MKETEVENIMKFGRLGDDELKKKKSATREQNTMIAPDLLGQLLEAL